MRNDPLPVTPAPVPVSGPAELPERNLRLRRQELAKRDPFAVTVAAMALAEMHAVAWGAIPEIAGDRHPRFRAMQLAGEKALPIEDLISIAVETDRGHRVATAGLRVLAAAAGFRLVPMEPEPLKVPDAGAALADAAGDLSAELIRALRDGRVDGVEAVRIRSHAVGVSECAAILEVSCAVIQ